MRKTLIVIILISAALMARGEAVGAWQLFHAYRNVAEIVPTGSEVFVVADAALYSYSPRERSLRTYDTTTGLNAKGIRHIAWCQKSRRLVVAYENSAVDLLVTTGPEAGTAIALNALADKDMPGEKTINSIYVSGSEAWLATAFGIVVVNTAEAYVSDTYRIGTAVERCRATADTLYAVTRERGTLACPRSGNPLNPNEWRSVGPYAPADSLAYTPDPANHCFWAADREGLLTPYTKGKDGSMTPTASGVTPDGPLTNSFWRLYIKGGTLYATAGAYSYLNYRRQAGLVHTFDGSRWGKLPDPPAVLDEWPYVAANCMLFDPKDATHCFVGALSGLYEYRAGDCVRAYSCGNSTLRGLYNRDRPDEANVTSMCLDKDGNLWALNGWTDCPLNRLSPDGTWTAWPHPEMTYTNLYGIDMLGAMLSPTNGDMWFVNCHAWTPALFRYSPATDQLTAITDTHNQDGLTVNAAIFSDVAEDKDGNIWVATDGGPLVMAAADVKAGRYQFQQHKVPRNDGSDLADYLLTGVNCTRVVIDSDNRKWFGTADAGLFVVSADCDRELHHFTTDNSPLPSNTVYDIAISPQTGLAYIATAEGLCAWQSDTRSEGAEMSADNIAVYPNPVTPEHTGGVTITGLDDATHILITSAGGQRVAEGTANGSTFRWDTRDEQGRPVGSGIYFVCLTRPDGSSGPVKKLAIVR